MKNTRFFQQAELLLQILPFFKKTNVFALKGGTAINFFLRDLPRLSVDIDFTYLPVANREESIKDISDSLYKATEQIKSRISDVQVSYKILSDSELKTGVVFQKKNISVKVEPNLVLRGSVYEPTEMNLCRPVEDIFGLSFAFTTLSKEDLYGGKICAALDRQHPRDLFDIKVLLDNEGLTDKIRKAFIVYLISHPRPMVELLNPNIIDISDVFQNEFLGMTDEPVTVDELITVRMQLVTKIRKSLTKKEKQFILSVKTGGPLWDLFALDHIKDLPAVKWKLENIKRMDHKKHKQAKEKLQKYLEL